MQSSTLQSARTELNGVHMQIIHNCQKMVVCEQRIWLLLISPHFKCVWREPRHISMRMFVQVQVCTCTSTLSSNAPQAYASRSRFMLTLIRSEVKSTVYAGYNCVWFSCTISKNAVLVNTIFCHKIVCIF